MKKEVYIRLLKEYLSGRIAEDELNDILTDYEGFFITGLEEGKTEDEISSELGDPKVIADSLAEGCSKKVSLCYAPVYKRIPALIIDVIVAGLPFIWFAPNTAIGSYFMPQVIYANMIPALLSTIKCSNHSWISQIRPFWTAAIIVSALWFLLINPLCMIIFKGYTIGKRIMKIRVVSADGTKAGFIQIITRECIGKYFINMLGSLLPSILALLPSIASLIWACASKEHRTIHDSIARTCVIDCEGQKQGKR